MALLPATAYAATLDQVRVFAGKGHARVLIVTRGTPAGLQSRSSPPVGVVPARAVVLLEGTTLGPEGERNIGLGDQGIRRLVISQVGEDAQLTVEMDEARAVHAQALGASAVLVDLTVEGRGGDAADLPSPEQLRAWVDGVSLVRQAGGPPRDRKLVVLDPGHGGFDHGAVGSTGAREADLVLELARRTRRSLEDRLGVEVLMTRDADVFIPLRERAALANRNDADVFVSIHANAAPTGVNKGIETYSLDTASDAGAARVAARENTLVREQALQAGEADPLLANLLVSGTNRLSQELAGEVQSSVIRRLTEMYGPGSGQVTDLGTRTALFAVLVSTRMPAILFESNFVSNPADERRLRTPNHQQLIADALVDAIGSWLDRQD